MELVVPFVPLHVPGTTRWHTRRAGHCLAARARLRAEPNYSGHSPTLRRLNHPADVARHRGTNPGGRSASSVSVDLHDVRHVGRTACALFGRSAYVHGSRHGIVSAPRSRGSSASWEGRIQKRPLTHRLSPLSRFGTVSNVAHQQGLVAPFIVELFAVRLFVSAEPRASSWARSRWSVPCPAGCIAALRTPDAGLR